MLSIPVISTMKGLPGALEPQVGTSSELEPTFSFVPASRPGRSESQSGPDTVNKKDVMAVCFMPDMRMPLARAIWCRGVTMGVGSIPVR
jgi:hypothetical protein